MVHSFGFPSPNTVKEELFDEIFVNLNKILGEYDIIFAGDLNIDELRPCLDSSKNHFSDIKDIISLENLIQKPACFKSRNSTLLHLILTNWPRGLKMKSQNIEIGLSDCQKLVCIILRASLRRFPLKL